MALPEFSLYAAFAAEDFGGSHAAVIANAANIALETRQDIANYIAAPATCFVDHVGEQEIAAQFFSAKSELPMCGHGTIGLMTHAVELGWARLLYGPSTDIKLRLPKATTMIRLHKEDDGRPRIMVTIQPSKFCRAEVDYKRLASILGVKANDFSSALPVEIACGDFIHLVVPMTDRASMGRITPDFDAITAFSHNAGVQTVTVFTTERERSDSTFRVRDFCPAVGVDESAAAGTTNAAMASYLVRHGLVRGSEGRAIVIAEQGMEIGKPSRICSELEMKEQSITALRVGGVAVKLQDGRSRATA